MGGHHLARVGDEGDVGLAVLVERGRHADDDAVHAGDHGEVGCRQKALGINLLLDGGAGDVLDVGDALVQGVDLAQIDVDADDLGAGAAELQGQGEADISETDDGDGFHGDSINELNEINELREGR